MLDATPDTILRMPGDSYLPLILALALTALFAGLLVQAWIVVALAFLAIAIDLFVWLWPQPAAVPLLELPKNEEVEHG